MAYNFNISEIEFESEYIPYLKRPETYIMPVIFLLILIMGVTGNGFLILILLCDAAMRNISNTYVFSLAVGDLLVILICVPFTAIFYTVESWPWGTTICKISEYAKDISIGVSVFTLAALAAERYCVIVNPIRRHLAGLSARITILTAILIWILAIVLALPGALFSYVKPIYLGGNVTVLICNPFPEEFGVIYEQSIIMFKFLAYYMIPLCVIAGFYLNMAWNLNLSTRNMPGIQNGGADLHDEQIQARKRVSKIVVWFIIVFVICFLPYHIFMLWFHFCPTALNDYNYYWHIFRIIGFCLSFSNSCINPIALYLINRTFREKFNKFFWRSGSAACGRNQTKSKLIRVPSLRRRRKEISSTFRRREFHLTREFEMVTIERMRPTIDDQN